MLIWIVLFIIGKYDYLNGYISFWNEFFQSLYHFSFFQLSDFWNVYLNDQLKLNKQRKTSIFSVTDAILTDSINLCPSFVISIKVKSKTINKSTLRHLKSADLVPIQATVFALMPEQILVLTSSIILIYRMAVLEFLPHYYVSRIV